MWFWYYYTSSLIGHPRRGDPGLTSVNEGLRGNWLRKRSGLRGQEENHNFCSNYPWSQNRYSNRSPTLVGTFEVYVLASRISIVVSLRHAYINKHKYVFIDSWSAIFESFFDRLIVKFSHSSIHISNSLIIHELKQMESAPYRCLDIVGRTCIN